MNNSTTTSKELNDFDKLVDFLEYPHFRNYLYFFIIFNSLSSILAVVLNFLVILTFVKTGSLRTPSYILILSLAFSDLGVGVVTQPAYCCRLIAWLMKKSFWYENSFNVYLQSYGVLITASFLTVTSITIDRFLAVHLNLRYQELVTTKRSYTVVIAIWVVSLSWCFVFATNINWVLIIDATLILIIAFLDISLMLNISRVIRRHSAQIQVQQQPQQPTMNMLRYKRSVKTMYYIMGVFLLCFLPGYIIFLIVYGLDVAGINRGIELHYALQLANTLAMMNSALNPFIYCWRIEEIRNALLQLLRRQSQ